MCFERNTAAMPAAQRFHGLGAAFFPEHHPRETWDEYVALIRRAGLSFVRMGGGFDKRLVARGPDAVRAELDRLAPVIREGGFVPGIDHSVSADISWDNYRAYLEIMAGATVMC